MPAATYLWDNAGRQVGVVNGAGKALTYTLDPVGNRSVLLDSDGGLTTYTHRDLGHIVTLQYDLLNRVTTQVRAAAVGVLLTESQDYDSRGAVLYRVDARGMRTTLFYDLNERLIARLDPLNAYTSYSYDKTARRIAVQSPTTAAGIAITSFGYDLRGLLTTLTFADNSAEVYDHDAVGRRTLIIRPSGKLISIVYDNMGRQTGLIPPDNAPPETLIWDSRSRRTLLIDGTGSTGFGYYDDGRLKTAATPKGKIEYGYDPGGRRTSMVYSAGTVLYGHDQDNNLSELTSAFGEVTEYQWDLAEKLTQVTLPNGSVVSLSYDMADRLIYKGDPNPLSGIGFKYELDMGGNRTTITENDGSVTTNVFDNKNRLITEIRTGLDPSATTRMI